MPVPAPPFPPASAIAPPQPCPLCGQAEVPFWLHETRRGQPARDYHRCPDCALIFVPPRFHLDRAAEKAEYDRHCNDPADQGYRRFLARLVEALCPHLPAGARGLDYGCGPGPVLSQLFAAAGFACADYDPLYRDDPALLGLRYDFIASTEVFEHFAAPAAEIQRLLSLLKPGGWLAVMTRRSDGLAVQGGMETAFARWHYSRDPTHIAFYADRSFAWIAERWGLALQLAGQDIALLRLPAAGLCAQAGE